MFVERLLERRGEEIATGTLTQNPFGSVSLVSSLTGGATSSGVRMNESIAEGIAAYFACRQVISETTGQVPLKVFRFLARGKEPDKSHGLYYILHDQFNPEMTAYEGKELLTRNVCDWGNGYGEIQWNGSRPVAIWPLAPQRMTVDRDGQNRRRYRYRSAAGQRFEWIWNPQRPPIFHLRMNSLDGLVGRGVPRILAETFGLTKAAEEFGSRYFSNNATPGVIAKYKGKLSPIQKQNLRESFQRVNGGLSNAHRLMILEHDIDVTPVSFNPSQSQLNELRGLQIEEVARGLRVPLFMIQHMTKSTSWGSGIEQMMRGFVNTTMMPWFTMWQQTIGRDLLTRKSFETHTALFVVEALLRASFIDQQSGLKIQKNEGVLTANEWREMVDRTALDAEFSDEPMVPVNNVVPASLAREYIAKRQIGAAGTPPADPTTNTPAPDPTDDEENEDA